MDISTMLLNVMITQLKHTTCLMNKNYTSWQIAVIQNTSGHAFLSRAASHHAKSLMIFL